MTSYAHWWLLRRRVAAVGRVWVHGGGQILVGRRVRIDAATAPVELHAAPGAVIAIGDDALIEGGTSIEAQEAVEIGPGCVIGRYCKVMDNNFHPLTGDRSRRPESVPVVVGARAVLGAHAILLPGARVAPDARVPERAVLRGPPPAARAGARAPAPARSDAPPSRLLARPAILDLIRRVSALLRARILLRACRRGVRVYAFGPVRIRNRGTVRLGDRVAFSAGPAPTQISCHPGGTIAVGEGCVFNYGASLEAFASVSLGRRCMIASSVRLCDRDGDSAGPIVVGDDVWLAHGAVVMPGVTIGDGSVVSAGSVVTRDVPPRALAIGDPARCMSLALVQGGRGPRGTRG